MSSVDSEQQNPVSWTDGTPGMPFLFMTMPFDSTVADQKVITWDSQKCNIANFQILGLPEPENRVLRPLEPPWMSPMPWECFKTNTHTLSCMGDIHGSSRGLKLDFQVLEIPKSANLLCGTFENPKF